MKELTFNRLTHHSFKSEFTILKSLYIKLFTDETLCKEDRYKLLAIIVLLSNQSDELLKKLSYRMALAYGVKTKDYSPLYDIAINTGLMPVVALLREVEELPFGDTAQSEFLSSMTDSYLDNFRTSNIVLTEQQLVLNSFFSDSLKKSVTVVAPTSYGKSGLIVSAINESSNKKICVLVPSKALLAQTKKRIIDANIQWVKRVVSHPEMHRENDGSSVHVLTQERMTRLLNQHKKLYFDIVIVDEAHNMLDKDDRNTLLASVLRVLEHRSPITAFKFLTPFLQDPKSLDLKNSKHTVNNYKISEYLKTECIYIADYRGNKPKTEFYDHFIDEFTELENSNKTAIDYLKNWSLNKNIIYFNRPKHIQAFAKLLSDTLPEIHSDITRVAIQEIAESTHEKYLLLHCLKHGVLYHHGSMTEAIRNYVEHIYRSCKEVKYLISSSTLLEGVNLPIERMFLFEIKKGRGNLSPSQFKNLIGRVNRFSDTFNVRSLKAIGKLLPEIHIVGTNDYLQQNANLHNFAKNVMQVSKKSKDKIENVLLEATDLDDRNLEEYNRLLNRLENLEEGITSDNNRPRVKTEIGLKLLEGNISDIDIFTYEIEIQEKLEALMKKHGKISDSNTLMASIYEAFIEFIGRNHKNNTKSLTRLQSDSAQTFYAMFIDWNIKKIPLGIMIRRFIKYWDNLPKDTPVFIGSWGDTTKGESHQKLFTHISGKSQSEKINLAIVRIKEEEDFFDYVIFRFVEILNEIGNIDETFYKLVKYGTTNKETIALIQNGFSRGVAGLLSKKYSKYYVVKKDSTAYVSKSIHQRLIDDGIGFLQRHEVSLNVKR